LNCSSCHSSPGLTATDATHFVSLSVNDYNPGVSQTIHVTVADPSATTWGFQLTARPVNNESQEAGTMSPVNSSIVQVRCDDGSQYGTPGPCNGTREFAEHVSSPHTAGGAGYTFDVSWTPPVTEVGDVQFWVAAVAGNGDGTPLGDHVYTANMTVSYTGACNFTKAPTLRTAVNGASFQAPFSSKAMMTVQGMGFQLSGLTRTAGAGDFVNKAFPTQLACVTVLVNGQPAPIAYVDQAQINIQAPAFAGVGPDTLVVVVNAGKPNELRSDVATLTGQQAFAPAFFTFGQSSSIAAQFVNSATPVADPTLVPGAQMAKPGDIVTLYGTGFGETTPSVGAGQLATVVSPLTTPVSVTIGGTQLGTQDVFYAGLSPGSISGLYQLDVRVPTTAPNGNLPVIATIGGFSSPTVTLPVFQPPPQ
jgi:uncharacterized protein (TIGR03437 family)